MVEALSEPAERVNKWKAVSLVAIARFDYEGDPTKKLFSLTRGEAFVITGEANEWYRGRRVDDRAALSVGIMPANYVEAMSADDAVTKLSACLGKMVALRKVGVSTKRLVRMWTDSSALVSEHGKLKLACFSEALIG